MDASYQSVDRPSRVFDQPDLESKSINKCGYLLIAMSIITLIGSLVAAGCLYSQLGYASFAIGGLGVIFGMLSFLLSRYCCARDDLLSEPISQDQSPHLDHKTTSLDDKSINIVLKNYGKTFPTTLHELHTVAEDYIQNHPLRDPVLKDIKARLDTKEFQNQPFEYVSRLIKQKPNGPIAPHVWDFLCALLRDVDTNPSFPWNGKK